MILSMDCISSSWTMHLTWLLMYAYKVVEINLKPGCLPIGQRKDAADQPGWLAGSVAVLSACDCGAWVEGCHYLGTQSCLRIRWYSIQWENKFKSNRWPFLSNSSHFCQPGRRVANVPIDLAQEGRVNWGRSTITSCQRLPRQQLRWSCRAEDVVQTLAERVPGLCVELGPVGQD